MEKGRHRQALASILRLEKELHPGLRTRVDLLAARCRLAGGEPDKALGRLEEHVGDRAMNMVRMLMIEAGHEHGVTPSALSFSNAMRLVTATSL
ncbi:MAG: hypothetical protein ACYTKD_20115, partial [Planctomycetota bacterium]